jgi:hypothetical protein
MKIGLLTLIGIAFGSLSSSAQCPYIKAALVDASNAGSPSGEGKNEFIVFNTGTSSINVNSLLLSYGTTTTSTSFSVDGSSLPNIWVSPTTSGLITNSAGTITHISSGSIPANRNVVVISKDNAISYDFQAFGTAVYVLSFDQTLAGVSGFLSSGRFPNTGATERYFRIQQGTLCKDTVSYIPDSLFGGDGAGVVWDASGIPNYQNTGGSGVVLPIALLRFDAKIISNIVQLNWATSDRSSAQMFVIEKGKDGILYDSIATIDASKNTETNKKEYTYTDKTKNHGDVLYRLRILDCKGRSSFSTTQKIKLEDNSSRQTYLYPNPVHHQLFLTNTKGFTAGHIVDFMGKRILELGLKEGNNSLELSELPNGIYWLQLKSSTEIENHQITKE